jgi:hypothetical protein
MIVFNKSNSLDFEEPKELDKNGISIQPPNSKNQKI